LGMTSMTAFSWRPWTSRATKHSGSTWGNARAWQCSRRRCSCGDDAAGDAVLRFHRLTTEIHSRSSKRSEHRHLDLQGCALGNSGATGCTRVCHGRFSAWFATSRESTREGVLEHERRRRSEYTRFSSAGARTPFTGRVRSPVLIANSIPARRGVCGHDVARRAQADPNPRAELAEAAAGYLAARRPCLRGQQNRRPLVWSASVLRRKLEEGVWFTSVLDEARH
jgi:hypothetical protein